MIYYSIDRFEGEFCVCQNLETGGIKNIPRGEIPEGAGEGTVISEQNGVFLIDVLKTKEREDIIARLSEGLWE